MSHTIAVGDMFLIYHEHTHSIYFDSIPHTLSCCPEILTRATSVNYSAAAGSPQNKCAIHS